jgi:hypothetical protein
LGQQISELALLLHDMDAPFALIGGLALASHNVVRATQDVDLLVPIEKADQIDAGLQQIGYRCLHRSENAGNYVRANRVRLDLGEVREYFVLFDKEPLLDELLAQIP